MRRNYNLSKNYYENLNLNIVWPSSHLRQLFEILLIDYSNFARHICKSKKGQNGATFSDHIKPFSILCERLIKSCSQNFQNKADELVLLGRNRHLEFLSNFPPDRIPQIIASVLAMLLHVDPFSLNTSGPTNQRRPSCRYSTYPNSPGLSQLLADIVIENIVTKPIPNHCHNLNTARKYVNDALNINIIDPSMEGGQLLIGIAESWVRKINKKHSIDSSTGKRLIVAGMERLCKYSLHGLDRNPLAKIAVSTVFRVFCESLNIKMCVPVNLNKVDSLKYNTNQIFDAVINNPPWGEQTTNDERLYIRQNFKLLGRRIETYLAFIEKSLSILKPNGVYAFVIPGTFLSCQNASSVRDFLGTETSIKFMSLLPRQVFADAANRSLIIAGKKCKTKHNSVFTAVSSSNFSDLDQKNKFSINSIKSRKLFSKSWQHLLLINSKSLPTQNLQSLGEISAIYTGKGGNKVKLLRAAVGHSEKECEYLFKNILPFGYVPAVLSRNIRPLILEDICFHSKREAHKEGAANFIDTKIRIGVREFVCGDGRLMASPISFSGISMKGVLTILPNQINVFLLTAILNSKIIANWIANNTGALINPGFKTISAHDLQKVPIPLTAINYSGENSSTLDANQSICYKMIQISKKIRAKVLTGDKKVRLFKQIDRLVEKLYEIK